MADSCPDERAPNVEVRLPPPRIVDGRIATRGVATALVVESARCAPTSSLCSPPASRRTHSRGAGSLLGRLHAERALRRSEDRSAVDLHAGRAGWRWRDRFRRRISGSFVVTPATRAIGQRGRIARGAQLGAPTRAGTALPVHSAIGPASPAGRLGASHIPAARRQPDIEGDHGPWEFPSDASHMPARASDARTWR
jgi:hypothetical protein